MLARYLATTLSLYYYSSLSCLYLQDTVKENKTKKINIEVLLLAVEICIGVATIKWLVSFPVWYKAIAAAS